MITSAVLSDDQISQLIREDVPYLDLTTFALGIGQQIGRITFHARHEMIVCGTEESVKVLEQCGATVIQRLPSGQTIAANTLILEAEGSAEALHIAWRIALNLLEYTSGIATRTRELIEAARRVNPGISLVTTRKVFPGTKSLMIKAVLAGGGLPHRLGLSETVLIFNAHLVFTDGLDNLIQGLEQIRPYCQEKKIAIELDNKADAIKAANAGFDIIQLDKLPVLELKETIGDLKKRFPLLKIAAAGSITQANVEEYAETGVDILVTSAPYFGKPADIAVKMIKLIKPIEG